MGGSTRVPLKIRIAVWLETVPALLKLLGVERVSLMCHSAGTIYLLNTLYHLREILDPVKPYVAIIGPWVDTEQSKVFLWSAASKLPVGMFDAWNGLGKFIQTQIAPSLSWSGGVISAVSGVFSSKPSCAMTPGQRYDTAEDVGKEIEKLQVKYFFEEDTTAANEELKLCAKKDVSVTWDVCDDYETYVQTFCTSERARKDSHQDEPKLEMHVYYAESDMMIGKGGQAYFDKCWNQSMVSEVVDYHSVELSGTDHDSALIDQDKGAMKHIFAAVGRAR
ncbi:uncharacterized protein LTR77_003681 [Saxophila tyrrhenica]|uniref:AB hydrolase-1 domain-containing protein n=1 Tax=Saxophila tyrrhenica TaxID=1690608 RepID=A0AAV9PIN1_9PEZI|nr:hypothetical protein LTR77_003681 [Saxophila tyrrhenica]